MSLGARLILLREQLNSRRCPRCKLYYRKDKKDCPHCSDLNDAQVEELLQKAEGLTHGSIWYLIFLMLLLGGALVLAVSIF
jgi:hypothetical protein